MAETKVTHYTVTHYTLKPSLKRHGRDEQEMREMRRQRRETRETGETGRRCERRETREIRERWAGDAIDSRSVHFGEHREVVRDTFGQPDEGRVQTGGQHASEVLAASTQRFFFNILSKIFRLITGS